jgi:hypothetical protein
LAASAPRLVEPGPGRSHRHCAMATNGSERATNLRRVAAVTARLGDNPDPRGEFTQVCWRGTRSVKQPDHQRPHGWAAQFFGCEVFGGVERKVAPAWITEAVPRAGGVQGKPGLSFGVGRLWISMRRRWRCRGDRTGAWQWKPCG